MKNNHAVSNSPDRLHEDTDEYKQNNQLMRRLGIRRVRLMNAMRRERKVKHHHANH